MESRRRTGLQRALVALGTLALLIELVVVVGGAVGASWWFDWGPNDHLFTYRISASVSEHRLTDAEVGDRYRTAPSGIYENPIDGLFGIVRSYESTYGRHNSARVVIRYRLNGGAERVWRWRAP